MMRGLGVLMIIVGAAFAFVVPYYQQHFTNFVIAERPVYADAEGYQTFDLEVAANDSPLEVAVRVELAYEGDGSGGRLAVPLIIDGPDGFILTDAFTITDADVQPEAANTSASPVRQWSHEHFFQDITVAEDSIYTFSLGPLVEEGYSAQQVDLTVIGNATPPWPDLTPLAWALFGVGGMAVMFSGRRKARKLPDSKTARIGRRQPSEITTPKAPPKKWGRD
ncbi:MAG: hypothetical protein WA921_10415 [Ahrensia sp.]